MPLTGTKYHGTGLVLRHGIAAMRVRVLGITFQSIETRSTSFSDFLNACNIDFRVLERKVPWILSQSPLYLVKYRSFAPAHIRGLPA